MPHPLTAPASCPPLPATVAPTCPWAPGFAAGTSDVAMGLGRELPRALFSSSLEAVHLFLLTAGHREAGWELQMPEATVMVSAVLERGEERGGSLLPVGRCQLPMPSALLAGPDRGQGC